MKITRLRTYLVNCYRTNWIFLKVDTDQGLSGVGEATLEYKEKAVVEALTHLESALVGKDARDVTRLRHDVMRDGYWRGGPVLMSALSAIDMALWDIKGKALGVPVFELLGGRFRDRIRAYANGWFAGARTPEEFAAGARRAVARGFTALKWDPFGSAYMQLSNAELGASLECVAAVRESVGPAIDLIVEGHGRFDVPTAVRAGRALEPHRILYFEEPIPPDNLEALAEVKERVPVSIAAGERLYHTRDFLQLIQRRAADLLQPDVSHAGGITGIQEIAALADAAYLPISPHNPSGPVANAATLQLAANLHNFQILEFMAEDVPWRREVTDEALLVEAGHVLIPGDRPGLGIELREEAFERYPYAPIELRHYKGTLTDIRPKDAGAYYR